MQASSKLLMIQSSKNSIARNTSVSSDSGRVPVAVKPNSSSLSGGRPKIHSATNDDEGTMLPLVGSNSRRLVPPTRRTTRQSPFGPGAAPIRVACVCCVVLQHRLAFTI